MKNILAFLIILLATASISLAKVNKEFVILIQAGHGGNDNGAKAIDGSYEKDYTLAYAKELEKIAKANNFRVVMCREDDSNFDLAKREEFIKLHKADLLISIHFGYNDDATKRGFDCYVPTETNITENRILGKFLGAELYNVKGMKFNGVNRNLVNDLNTLSAPNTIVELGYLSNADDVAFIKKDENKQVICEKLMNAIMRYKVQIETNK